MGVHAAKKRLLRKLVDTLIYSKDGFETKYVMIKENVEKVLKNGKNEASEIISEASLKTQKSLGSLCKMSSDILLGKNASVVGDGSGKRSLGEPLASISYLSVFIPHFLGRPAENRKILRKLYLDFDLSTYQISEITGWSRNSISEFLCREKIVKRVVKSLKPKFGERCTGGFLHSHQAEQKIIQKILALKAKGTSNREIAKILNDNGTLTKKGCQWEVRTVQSIYKREQEKKT